MTRTAEMTVIGNFSLPNRARLMLDIGAPRIAMRSAEVKGAFRELQHASAAQVARSLAGVPGLEALAVLGSLPTNDREVVIRQLQPDERQKTELLDLARTMGDPDDQQSFAATLTTMYPEIAERGEDSLDSGETEPVQGETETISAGELEELAATIAAWTPPDQARRALFILLPVCFSHGSPFPLEFWTQAAERVREPWIPQETIHLIGLAMLIDRLGDPDVALDLLRMVRDKATDPALQTRAWGEIADILQSRGELDETLRIRREEELPVYERLGEVSSRAMTMGKIADILTSRGESDEALRIRREEELPSKLRIFIVPIRPRAGGSRFGD